MSTIVTRSGKGSPLTHVEVDANFTNLNTDKYQEGSAIGATTPAAGTFTTLTATGQTSLGGAAGSEGLRVLNVASTVNYVQARGHITANAPSIRAAGSDTNIGLGVSSQGTGAISFYSSSISFEQMRVAHTASAVNYVQVTGAATGGNPYFISAGSDSNIGLVLATKGTGAFGFWTNGGANQQFSVTHTASAVNRIQATGSAAGAAPVLSAQGTDTNIPLVLQPKGTGALQAQQTDSTATGGNARGANAVDWQMSRSSASQVASGFNAVIAGGATNLASGYQSAIVGGAANSTTGVYAFAGAGYLNSVSGQVGAVVVNGYGNTAGGNYNFIGTGYSNSGTSNSAVTTQSATMNGTTAVTLSGSNANIKVGQLITGTSISSFPNTYVAAVSGTSLTLSQAASGSSTSTLSFFTPHGVVVGGGNNQATGSYSFIGGGGDAGTAGNRNVASGDWSTVGGGFKNTASGAYSSVLGGTTNTASGNNGSFVGGGSSNNALGFSSSVVGGSSNTANANWAGVFGGQNNAANAVASSVLGGERATARSIVGNTVFSASSVPIANASGVQQTALLLLARQTTDATATVLTSDTSAAGTTNQVILPNNSAYYFRGTVVAGVTGAGNASAWSFEGLIERGANAASTVVVGTPVLNLIAQDSGASTWAIAVAADTTNGGLKVTVTGQASTTIRWVAKIETTEMTY
jgi:hypothetical protein